MHCDSGSTLSAMICSHYCKILASTSPITSNKLISHQLSHCCSYLLGNGAIRLSILPTTDPSSHTFIDQHDHKEPAILLCISVCSSTCQQLKLGEDPYLPISFTLPQLTQAVSNSSHAGASSNATFTVD